MPKLLIMGIVAAILLHLCLVCLTLRRTLLTDPHAWASANVMTISRSYAAQGIGPLRGLQIANNPPMGKEPDIYTHWPPLFPMLLSRLFLLFGESEAVGRGLAVACYGFFAFALFFLVRFCCGPTIAGAAVLAFFTIPVSYTFSHLVLGLNLSMACGLVAVFAMMRAATQERFRHHHLWLGIAATMLGVLSSWEALLLPLILLGIAVVQRKRDRITIAFMYLAAATVTFGFVVAVYFIEAPQKVAEFWSVLLYRMGLRNYVVHGMSVHELPYQLIYTYHSKRTAIELLARNISVSKDAFGDLGLLAVAGTLIAMWYWLHGTKRDNVALLLTTFFGSWVLWLLLMPAQVADNSYEMMLAVPAVSICIALAFLFICYELFTNRVCRAGLVIVLLLPLATYVWRTEQAKDPHTAFAFEHDVQADTEANAVVLAPNPDMCTIYYSHRHVIRAVHTDAVVKFALQHLDDIFPGQPIYIAVPPSLMPQFEQSIAVFPMVAQTSNLLLLRVGTAGTGRMAAAAATMPGPSQWVAPQW